MEEVDALGRISVIPKTKAGIPVDPNGANLAEVAAKLTVFDKDEYYLAICVWSDSFGHFAAVRDILVRHHFEYRLILLPDDEKIQFGSVKEEPIVF